MSRKVQRRFSKENYRSNVHHVSILLVFAFSRKMSSTVGGYGEGFAALAAGGRCHRNFPGWQYGRKDILKGRRVGNKERGL